MYYIINYSFFFLSNRLIDEGNGGNEDSNDGIDLEKAAQSQEINNNNNNSTQQKVFRYSFSLFHFTNANNRIEEDTMVAGITHTLAKTSLITDSRVDFFLDEFWRDCHMYPKEPHHFNRMGTPWWGR